MAWDDADWLPQGSATSSSSAGPAVPSGAGLMAAAAAAAAAAGEGRLPGYGAKELPAPAPWSCRERVPWRGASGRGRPGRRGGAAPQPPRRRVGGKEPYRPIGRSSCELPGNPRFFHADDQALVLPEELRGGLEFPGGARFFDPEGAPPVLPPDALPSPDSPSVIVACPASFIQGAAQSADGTNEDGWAGVFLPLPLSMPPAGPSGQGPAENLGSLAAEERRRPQLRRCSLQLLEGLLRKEDPAAAAAAAPPAKPRDERLLVAVRHGACQTEAEATEPVDLCVICLLLPRTFASFPCGHRCWCRECAARSTKRGLLSCPLCREPATLGLFEIVDASPQKALDAALPEWRRPQKAKGKQRKRVLQGGALAELQQVLLANTAKTVERSCSFATREAACQTDGSLAQRCARCGGQPVDVAVMPCGHRCLCEPCACEEDTPDICPICGAEAGLGFYRIYG